MKEMLIDYLCEWFNLQRKPLEVHRFKTTFDGLQSITKKEGTVNVLNFTEENKVWCQGYRVYEVTCTIKLLG